MGATSLKVYRILPDSPTLTNRPARLCRIAKAESVIAARGRGSSNLRPHRQSNQILTGPTAITDAARRARNITDGRAKASQLRAAQLPGLPAVAGHGDVVTRFLLFAIVAANHHSVFCISERN